VFPLVLTSLLPLPAAALDTRRSLLVVEHPTSTRDAATSPTLR
jgi:hypothetical protein